jgi:peptide/nickel transport system permease protein
MSVSPRGWSARLRTRSGSQRRVRRLPWLSLLTIGVFVLAGALAPWISPHDPIEPDLLNRLQGPSSDFWLGTDSLGRDVLSRLIHGARATMLVVVLALGVGMIVGVVLGLVAGFLGGFVDGVISRIADSMLAFPTILFGLILAVTRGPSLASVVFAVALVLWARFALVVRSEVVSWRERDFVAQARIIGCSRFRIICVHIFPNVAGTITTLMSINVGHVILAEASLSFLGAGIPAPAASWGGMIDGAQDYLTDGWWISVFPGLAIMITILAFNGFGDWLRQRLDPKVRGELG